MHGIIDHIPRESTVSLMVALVGIVILKLTLYPDAFGPTSHIFAAGVVGFVLSIVLYAVLNKI